MAPLRMIMDVDTGVDDALALALAVRHPDIQLEAVLTVAGNVGLDLTTSNTLRVLDALGASDVTVAAGADRPLSGLLREASHWHGVDGLGGARLADSGRHAEADGISYLIERVMAEPGLLTLVCTGPLTNLALALRRRPDFADAVAEVVVMGGAAQVPGNVTPVAEFNIYADPDAAALVFAQTWRVTMVGLDVTHRVVFGRGDRTALSDPGSSVAVMAREVTRYLFDVRGFDSMALHDPLAVGVALDPSLVSTIQREVLVETRGEHTLGQTVIDMRPNADPPSLPTRVCVDVDAGRFRAMFLKTLGFSA